MKAIRRTRIFLKIAIAQISASARQTLKKQAKRKDEIFGANRQKSKRNFESAPPINLIQKNAHRRTRKKAMEELMEM
jgi:hypothetical protein